MRSTKYLIPLLAVAVVAFAALPTSTKKPVTQRSVESLAMPDALAKLPMPLATLPVAWVPNVGQLDDRAEFLARSGNLECYLTDSGAMLAARDRRGDQDSTVVGAAVGLRFKDAKPTRPLGVDELPGRLSFIRGNDRANWFCDVPTFSSVTQRNIYPGVTVVWHDTDHKIEYDIHVDATGDLSSVVVDVDGGNRIDILADGSLSIETAIGEIRQSPPVTVAVGQDGVTRNVAARFRRVSASQYGFEVDDRRAGDSLAIDPMITFVSYLGGSSYDEAQAVTIDAAGAIYITGRTASTNFPRSTGCFDTSLGGNFDAFVVKLDSNGTTLLYGTYLGSNGSDAGHAIAVDSGGQAVVAGYGPNGFPVTAGAYDTTQNGWNDGWIAKLNATGTGLVYATYLGGSNEDRINSLALAANGEVLVTGQTMSTNFPVTANALDSTPRSNWDGFVAKLSATGSTLGWSTRLGGSGTDWSMSVAVAANGDAIVAGGTGSANFPTTGGAVFAGGTMDAFVARISQGTSLVFSRLLGGPGADQATATDVGPNEEVVVVGFAGVGFPSTPGAYKTTVTSSDAFAACFSSNGTTLNWSTLLGGISTDQANGVAVDSQGCVFLAGYTNSADFPVTSGALDSTFNGGGSPADGFITKLNSTGTSVHWSTFLGGAGYEDIRGLALDAAENTIVIAGAGVSTNLPTTPGTLQATAASLDNGFVAKICLGPVPSQQDVGIPCQTPGAPHPTLVSTEATIGQIITLTGSEAPPQSLVWVFSGYVPNAPTISPLTGCPIYLDLGTTVLQQALYADSQGGFSVVRVVPPDPIYSGALVRVQALAFSGLSADGVLLTEAIQFQMGY